MQEYVYKILLFPIPPLLSIDFYFIPHNLQKVSFSQMRGMQNQMSEQKFSLRKKGKHRKMAFLITFKSSD